MGLLTDQIRDNNNNIRDNDFCFSVSKMDFSEENRVVYTCGVCETTCDQYLGHPCLMNFKEVYVDNNSYFYPMMNDRKSYLRYGILEDGTEGIIVEHREVPDDNDNYSTEAFNAAGKMGNAAGKMRNAAGKIRNVAGKTPSIDVPSLYNQKKLNDMEIETLLMEVQRRTPLWNYKVPLEKRKRHIIESLWDEVSATLNRKLDADECKTRFKGLRDTHRKIIKAELNGSGKESSEPQWKFYRSCEFLRDFYLITSAGSNVAQSRDNSLLVDDDLIVDDHDYLAEIRSQPGIINRFCWKII